MTSGHAKRLQYTPGQANVDQGDLAGVIGRSWSGEPELESSKGCRGGGAHGHAQRFARVSVQTGRNVEGEYGLARAIYQIDDRVQWALDRRDKPVPSRPSTSQSAVPSIAVNVITSSSVSSG